MRLGVWWWAVAWLAIAASACSSTPSGPTVSPADVTATADAAATAGSDASGMDAAAGDAADGSDAVADSARTGDGNGGDGSQVDGFGDEADGSVDAAGGRVDTAGDSTGGAAADVAAVDAAADGGAAPDATGPADVKADVQPAKGVPSATITAPKAGTVIEAGQAVDMTGVVSDSLAAASDLVVTWSSDKDGVLGSGKPDSQGLVSLAAVKLSAGKHQIQLEAKNPQGISATDAVSIGVCSWKAPESFNTQLDGAKWKIYGDAYWDAGGWLEMTGNAQGKFGKIWNISDYVAPGDVQISFQIATGGGINGGADGFALSVIDAKDVSELEGILAKAGNGGCLGYGVAGGCGNMKIGAFHVEMDTFQNTGDPNTDPTFDNHIAVTLDGDPSKHWLWAATPAIEDLQWHTVTVEVKLDKVRVTLDGKELFNQAIPDFKFRGGFIGFSGSTGWASNFHRIDNLQILQQCLVQ